MNEQTKRLALVVILAIFIGLFASRQPDPKPDRPVLKWISRAAHTALWFMLMAEKPPEKQEQMLVHARVDEQGNPVIDHARGW